jgi:DNA polymerase zeta
LYEFAPPSTSTLQTTLSHHAVPDKVYREPHYSRGTDAPEKPREYSGLIYNLKGGDGLTVLESWNDGTIQVQNNIIQKELDGSGVGGWEFASCPPSAKQARRWLKSDVGKRSSAASIPKGRSQVSSRFRCKRNGTYVATRSKGQLRSTLMV